MRKRAVLIMAMMAILTMFAAGHAEGREIMVQTAVTKWGQMPRSFEVTGQALPEDVSAADFAISGEAAAWGATATHPFACGVEAVEATDGGWRLIPERFPDKYFYVKKLEIVCANHPELSFTLEDIARTDTATADEFTLYEDAERMLTAHVYLPEAEGPCPVVIVFHGYGDTQNLLTYRTAIPWAEAENQAVRPCVVIAPTIPDPLYSSEFARSKVFEGVMAYVDALAGSVVADPKRVYAMGNSFGGMSSFELAEQYPDRIAAVLALCPALNYSAHGTQRLAELNDLPVTIVQAEHDETIPVDVGRAAAQALADAGNESVVLRVYSDEEMFAAGASLGSENTYSFHHVELAAMEGAEFERYAQWLFGQAKP